MHSSILLSRKPQQSTFTSAAAGVCVLGGALAVCCSLVGHRSNCLTIDFNPDPSCMAVTGSLDTNIKVWDLRTKDAITTYKGHSSGVRKLAISPDGKWVCSGSESGELKVSGNTRQLTLQQACPPCSRHAQQTQMHKMVWCALTCLSPTGLQMSVHTSCLRCAV